ncbi:hypothetical protein HPB50_016468 [Hyalomma asiaticum]|uniref:Uncharacterized protein n=1 Tax=Hyalomma asiaticum TaxID=266040 RepID=A0ACB7RV31_HYAAI|nr:hypothetical protein HPB50_016468 [Hyalomma asiaticum]
MNRFGYNHKAFKEHVETIFKQAEKILHELQPPGFIVLAGLQCYQSSHGPCSFRCIYPGRLVYILSKKDGRPCNNTNPAMRCKKGECV